MFDKPNKPMKETGDRIVNGEATEPDEFPWIVSLQALMRNNHGKKKWVHLCGGSLLTPNLILTAAHCDKIFDAEGNLAEFRIVAGKL
jgi:secreted trypsin-like serine protease